MKKYYLLILFIALSITIIGCTADKKEQMPKTAQSNTDNNTVVNKNNKKEQTKDYLMFTLNVHDWVFPDKSADAVIKTINLHEKYNVPLDIYLDDQVMQVYLADYPEVIEKIKSSSLVAVSYHVRAPHPMSSGFTFLLKDRNQLIDYEEHALNLETGQYIESKPGGYQLIKDTFGYAPLAVGVTKNDVEKVYADKGATFKIIHGQEIKLGDKSDYLYYRPENVEIKWYEQNRAYMHNDITAQELIANSIGNQKRGGLFINIKMHENNYYTEDTPFWPVYWQDSQKTLPLQPPYDTSAGQKQIRIRPADYTQSMWEFYENALQYASENLDQFELVNNKDLLDLL
ncbi:MAG: hypothetical protein V1898_00480 [Patescibacteria group bacterium]